MRDPLAPMSLEPAIDARLWNWGRWAQPHFGSDISMTGIVCRMLMKDNFVFDGPSVAIDADIPDALLVEDLWRKCALSKPKIVTRAHYVVRIDYRDIARYFGFSFRRWDEELALAARQVVCGVYQGVGGAYLGVSSHVGSIVHSRPHALRRL